MTIEQPRFIDANPVTKTSIKVPRRQEVMFNVTKWVKRKKGQGEDAIRKQGERAGDNANFALVNVLMSATITAIGIGLASATMKKFDPTGGGLFGFIGGLFGAQSGGAAGPSVVSHGP